jgi:GT2 family glycosyltransferase
MNLSIIIVNYKTPELLKNCLTSVYGHTRDIEFEVIVVDNFSQDNSETIVKEYFPKVRWIQMDYNAGFARANNEGIRNSEGDIVLLLNSDTVVTDNAIGNCCSIFKTSLNVACGVQLLNADGSPQISGNYFMRGGLNNLLPLPYTGQFLKSLATLFKVKKPHVSEARTEEEVDWINGAYLMVKKSVIKTAGMLDEDFFLYAEEAEWCYRIKKFGRLVIYGQFRIIHLQGETSNATFKSESIGYYNLYDRKGLQIMLSNFVRIRKQFGIFWLVVHLLVYTLTLPVFFIGTMLECLFRLKNPSGYLKRVRGFTVNLLKLWKNFPVIVVNRPFFYKVL